MPHNDFPSVLSVAPIVSFLAAKRCTQHIVRAILPQLKKSEVESGTCRKAFGYFQEN